MKDKESDSAPKPPAESEEKTSAAKRLELTVPDFEYIPKTVRDLGLITANEIPALPKISFDLGSSPIMSELTLASRAIADFRLTPTFQAIAADAARISEQTKLIAAEIERSLAPLRLTMDHIKAEFSVQLEADRRAFQAVEAANSVWARQFDAMSVEIAKTARLNFAIPETALLHWAEPLVISRAAVLQDCVLNMAALENFRLATAPLELAAFTDQLAAATQFVFNHREVVRRLPPNLPVLEPEEPPTEVPSHRDEEIGAKLEAALGVMDRRLLQLRQRAWSNLTGGVAGARLAMTGIRELFTDVLHALAPDGAVKATPAWRARPESITRPTRRMRLEYVLGPEGASEADAMFQFAESVEHMQKFVHQFADDVELVRMQMAQVEIWVYLLLSSDRRTGSNS